MDQFVEHVDALAAREGARDGQELRQRERVDQHGIRHRRPHPGVERLVAGERLAAGEEHAGRGEPGLDQPEREARIAGEHGHAVAVADLDRALRLAGAERDAGDAMRLHLRLVEQPGDEQVIAEGHRADIALAYAAGGEMGARRGDHALEIAGGLEHRHQRRPHRRQVDPDRPRPAEPAIAGLRHLGHEIGPRRQRYRGGEVVRIGDLPRQPAAIERVVAETRERPVDRLPGEAHQRLESASAAASS